MEKAKEYLGQSSHLDREILYSLEQIKCLRGLSASIGQLQPTASPPIRESMGQLEEMQRELAAKVRDAIQTKRQLKDQIDRLQDPDCRAVLELRYLCGLTWEKVAARMNFSSIHVQRIHKRAMAGMEKLL